MAKLKSELPKFVTLNGAALRLTEEGYYRDAGHWWVGYKNVKGKLMSVNKEHSSIHNVELKPTNKAFWKKNNYGYIDGINP